MQYLAIRLFPQNLGIAEATPKMFLILPISTNTTVPSAIPHYFVLIHHTKTTTQNILSAAVVEHCFFF